MMEIWMDIIGYDGVYQVSNTGKIKSFHNGKETILKPNKNTHGYMTIKFHYNRVGITKTVHGIVANHFMSKPTPEHQVNHIDGDKTNNRLDNLEWVTGSENKIHAYKTGLMNVNHLKRAVSQLNRDGEEIARFDSLSEAGKHTGIQWVNIRKVCIGERKSAGGFKWEFWEGVD